MTLLKSPLRTGLAVSAGLAAMLLAAPALAQNAPAPGSVDSVKLLELLVENGTVTRAQADRLIAEATVAPAPAAPAAMPAPEAGSQRVQYIPEVVRLQIKDELRAEVTAQARAEGWAQPGLVPDWLQGVTLTGDVRVRAEAVSQDDENLFTFPDFNAINAGSGFDTTLGDGNAPFLNTTEDRQRARIRARLGLQARINDWTTAEIRIATGNDASPVSTNQTLGTGGYFSKYELWLDRAAIQLTPMDGLALTAGRAANPFWTSDLLFDDDLNFDGVSARYEQAFGEDFSGFVTAGAFPIFNTDFNFGDKNVPVVIPNPDEDDEDGGSIIVPVPQSFDSRDQYLLAVQAGARWAPSDDVAVQAGVGYFHFDKVRAALSSPCFAPDLDTVCDTDSSRSTSNGFGNSQFAIRDITLDPNNPDGPQYQYFGRASEFEVLNARARIDLARFAPFHVRLEGDLVWNLGYDEVEILQRGPVNNFESDTDGAGPDVADYDSGDFGWSVNATVGAPELDRFGNWRVSVGYRYLEADAVVDSFTDSDFHLGGTNAQGFVVGGEFAVGRNTWLAAKWLSANEVSGAPYANDVFQLDLNAKF